VVVIGLDFSKAFDTVRHATLAEKLAALDLPDCVYNWLCDFLGGRSHCTEFKGDRSNPLRITASVIQGSAVGPVAYAVAAGDLSTVTQGNHICKYADDTYLVIPASNVGSCAAELDNVDKWAKLNNLKLNRAKSTEIVFHDTRRRHNMQKPPEIAGIQRVSVIKILGVTVTSGLSVAEHVQDVLRSCAQSLYVLKVLRAHGFPAAALHRTFQSVVLAKILYASSAWSGFCTQSDKDKINSFIRRAVRAGFCACTHTFDELCSVADDRLFHSVLNNADHVLHRLLPPISSATPCYNLRPRAHNRQIPARATHLTDCCFFTRVLYLNSY
jgi:hypothetical protein